MDIKDKLYEAAKNIADNSNGSWIDMVTEGIEYGLQLSASEIVQPLVKENETLNKQGMKYHKELCRLYERHGEQQTLDVIHENLQP